MISRCMGSASHNEVAKTVDSMSTISPATLPNRLDAHGSNTSFIIITMSNRPPSRYAVSSFYPRFRGKIKKIHHTFVEILSEIGTLA